MPSSLLIDAFHLGYSLSSLTECSCNIGHAILAPNLSHDPSLPCVCHDKSNNIILHKCYTLRERWEEKVKCAHHCKNVLHNRGRHIWCYKVNCGTAESRAIVEEANEINFKFSVLLRQWRMMRIAQTLLKKCMAMYE